MTVRYRDVSGRQKKKSFREPTAAKTRKAAKDHAARLRTQLADGDYVDPGPGKKPFAEVARHWLDEANPTKRESAWARDDIVIRVHLDSIKDMPMSMIQPKDIRALVASWSSSLAPRTVHRNYGVVRAVFRWAEGEDIIRRSPCRGIKLPSKGGAPTGRALTADELAKLTSAMERGHAVMTWVMALLGLRWGEAAALRVGSIKFGNPSELSVTETVQRGVGGRSFLGPPKSDAGQRRLTMPKALADLLAAHLADRGLTAADAGALVFVNSAGDLWDATNWRRRVWQPAAIAAGLGQLVKRDGNAASKKYVGITPHDLRRTNATALVGADVDIKTAQARLGHSDVRMTLDVYARVLAERDEGAADAVAQALMSKRGDG